MVSTLETHHPTITQACQRHNITRLSVFGSALHKKPHYAR